MYRYQVVNVGYWRGQIKRWNTTFYYNNSSNQSTLRGIFQAVGWPQPGDVTGDCSGGVASITVYNAAGGPPITISTYFDWKTPSTWIPYTGTAWVGVDPDTPLDASGESAAVIVGKMGYLSSRGKPVTVRKYLHAIPSRQSNTFSDPDITTAAAAGILAAFSGTSYLYTKAGALPVSAKVSPWYLNHQRVRGRRRTVKSVAAQSFSAGVVAGSGVPSGAASPQ